MTLFDLVVVAVVLFSALFALMRGFIREVIALAAWIAGLVLAFMFAGPLAAQFESARSSPVLAQVLAFAAILVAVLIVGGIIAAVLSGAIRAVGLGGLDRLLGGACGVLRALAFVLLQHRGQDAAGIATAEGPIFHMHRGNGYVRDVFRTRNMRDLLGNIGIGHCRYPTAGSWTSDLEAQPFYVNSPFGITLAHNGNLTNSEALKRELFQLDFRHVNNNSDSEVLLNVLALELERAAHHSRLDAEAIFTAVAGVHRRSRGAYAIVAMIAGYGLLAFRDPYGIRPLVIGVSEAMGGREYMVASESVALEALGFEVLRDVTPGEAIFIDQTGRFHARQCADNPRLCPCIFEFVYLARPDSVIDGISVYEQ